MAETITRIVFEMMLLVGLTLYCVMYKLKG